MIFVVKSCLKHLVFVVTGLLFAIIMPAQNLPVLEPDKAVKTGVLPNGTSYYIVANPTIKGMADFALVQRTGTGNVPDSLENKAVAVSREALCELPRCTSASVQEFFSSHGVTPGKEGYVKVTDNATEYHFQNVLLSKKEVLDSALLVMLDMVDRISSSEDPFVRKWYAPSDQAVVVVGDVDASQIEEKLRMLSYMTPSYPSSPRKDYVWVERDSALYRAVPAVHDSIATITLEWNSARTPVENMNTVQPAIYEVFLSELGMVAEESIKHRFFIDRIPHAEIKSAHKTSLHSSGDESFSISVSVAGKDFTQAVGIVAEELGRIDAGYADIHDLVRMKKVCMESMKEQTMNPIAGNTEYVDRCVNAFVYNGSLSTLKTKVDFLSTRILPDSTELRLFNRVSSALLDPERNLRISYSYPIPEDSLRAVFAAGWESAKDMVPQEERHYGRTDISPRTYLGPKLKVSEKTDHMSKGLEWTFSNGFKVVYRRMPTNGKLYYTLALNGGFSAIDNLEKGEGGYVSDYFMLSRICGMPAEEFLNVLACEGMSMDVYTALNTTMINGSIADDKDVGFMMNALLAALYDRVVDAEAVAYYESSEPLRSALRSNSDSRMVAKVNEIMCPDYKYVSHKMLDSIPSDLSLKAEKFYRQLFEKTNDGVLILLGDVEPNVIKKIMMSYAGCFATTNVAFRKPLVRYLPASGWSTYTVEGDRNSVDISMSVPLALTADNFMAAEVAVMVLKKHLSEAIADTGMYLEMLHECRIYPNERINFHISLNEVSQSGFALGTTHTGPIEAINIVRSVLSGEYGLEVTKEDVDAFKDQIKTGLDMEMKIPFYWLNVISRRHLAGKDFTTSYEARIKSVTVERVRDILSKLDEGTRVEYIVSK